MHACTCTSPHASTCNAQLLHELFALPPLQLREGSALLPAKGAATMGRLTRKLYDSATPQLGIFAAARATLRVTVWVPTPPLLATLYAAQPAAKAGSAFASLPACRACAPSAVCAISVTLAGGLSTTDPINDGVHRALCVMRMRVCVNKTSDTIEDTVRTLPLSTVSLVSSSRLARRTRLSPPPDCLSDRLSSDRRTHLRGIALPVPPLPSHGMGSMILLALTFYLLYTHDRHLCSRGTHCVAPLACTQPAYVLMALLPTTVSGLPITSHPSAGRTDADTGSIQVLGWLAEILLLLCCG